ncbi:hypothetical protein GLOIN_2v1485655 [Rhizophagus clarus]|uniref:Uncharacterized protein n=1 Tax=Rhizophagus clarus TaxID=94130 RepID=A0A8H3LU67_9GLOM|nr:hypothetical protein GLOIN_2v1485655 [Rhizophagus clarus]
MSLDQEFPFSKEWILKENLKFGNKGRGKYISKKVVQYLQELAIEEKLTLEEIPTVKTIKGWIERYNANFKKVVSEKTLFGNMEN